MTSKAAESGHGTQTGRQAVADIGDASKASPIDDHLENYSEGEEDDEGSDDPVLGELDEDVDTAADPIARLPKVTHGDFRGATQRTAEEERKVKYKQSTRKSTAADALRRLEGERLSQDLAIPLGAMDGKERSGEGLKKRINARNTALLVAMTEILDATTEPDTNKRDSMTIMSRQLRTQFSTQQIVRSCEDLLTLIRWMQERWLCGNLNTIGQNGVEAEKEKDAQVIIKLLKKLNEGAAEAKNA